LHDEPVEERTLGDEDTSITPDPANDHSTDQGFRAHLDIEISCNVPAHDHVGTAGNPDASRDLAADPSVLLDSEITNVLPAKICHGQTVLMRMPGQR
jgi:hypothetical protein